MALSIIWIAGVLGALVVTTPDRVFPYPSLGRWTETVPGGGNPLHGLPARSSLPVILPDTSKEAAPAGRLSLVRVSPDLSTPYLHGSPTSQ